MSWDESVEMAGEFPCYWAVLRNDEGLVEVWQSPYEPLPNPDRTEDERKGLITYLAQPLSAYSDMELSIAAQAMAKLAMEDWALACLVNPIFRALKEQREREGGYQPSEKTEAEEA